MVILIGERPALVYLLYKLAVVVFFWANLIYNWADYTVGTPLS